MPRQQRLLVRWANHSLNLFGFVQLASFVILLDWY
jgi:hypothetical protein